MDSGIARTIFEGGSGVMQAVNCSGPNRGFWPAIYAMWWIRAAIQEYILHSWSPVKMGTTRCRRSGSSTCAG
jgi:DNA-directed RNA polymerase sigma subunit (sigma70/sigma32)